MKLNSYKTKNKNDFPNKITQSNIVFNFLCHIWNFIKIKLNIYKNRDRDKDKDGVYKNDVYKDDVSNILAQSNIHEFAEEIKTQMSKIEPIFLVLGQDMQQIYFDSDKLTQIITDAAKTIDSQAEGGLVNYIQKSINTLLKELNECRETINVNIAHMGSSTDELETLCSICSGLTKISRVLNIVGMYIDVEACRFTESKNMFLGFGKEVKELAQKISVIADHIYSDSKSVQSTQISGVENIKSSLEKLSSLSASAEESVMHAMNKVERLTRLSCSALDNAAIHSREIQKRVGDIVMSIQFHDIVRQKLEHVISAFDDCKNILTMNASSEQNSAKTASEQNPAKTASEQNPAKTASEQNLTRDESEHNLQRGHAQIYFVLKIQSAQLALINSELNTVHAKLEQAFAGINEKTDILMNDVVNSGMDEKASFIGHLTLSAAAPQFFRDSLKKSVSYYYGDMKDNDKKELENEFDSIKNELENELENLIKVRTHGQKISEEIMKSIRDASSIVSGLSQYTGQVDSININLQYKALNAIIMTSKLGDKGLSLEVLAREVGLLSLNSNALIEQIVKSLRAVTKITDTLEITDDLKELNKENSEQPNEENLEQANKESFRQANKDNSMQMSDKSALSLDNTLNLISTILSKYQENRNLSVSMAQELGKNIEKSKEQIDCIAQWANSISAIQTQINKTLERIEPLILSMDKEILTEFQHIEKRYTMESERVIHNQMSMKKKDSSVKDDKQDDSDIFFQDDSETISQDDSDILFQDDSDILFQDDSDILFQDDSDILFQDDSAIFFQDSSPEDEQSQTNHDDSKDESKNDSEDDSDILFQDDSAIFFQDSSPEDKNSQTNHDDSKDDSKDESKNESKNESENESKDDSEDDEFDDNIELF
ncbi:MAG: hypothetical protein HQK67_04445 [Desulfamplus sp.]|nr:hypothetical protein [Desulfamplus sp.]